MERLKNFVLRNKLTLGVGLTACLTKIIWFRPHQPFWDGAVYILMGKYLLSSGQVGLLEAFRPILWPGLLGMVWKTGLDPISWGRIITTIFSLANILLLYLIGKISFGKDEGLLSTLFLIFSPTYLFWSNCLYSDIPASFFGLLFVYLYLRNKYLISGIIASVAFFTKFTQIIPIILISIYSWKAKTIKASKGPTKFLLGLVLGASIFLLIHYYLYPHIFFPFLEGKKIYTQRPFVWYKYIGHSFKILLTVESWFFIFIPMGFVSLGQEGLDKKKITLFLIGLLSFLWVAKLPIELPRLFIPAIPYLYLFSSVGIIKTFRLIRSKVILKTLFILLLIMITGGHIARIALIRFPKDRSNFVHTYITENAQEIERARIWIANPTFLSPFDYKAHEVMYYPIFDKQKAHTLNHRLSQADYIFWDNRTLLCRPINDLACETAKEKLFNNIRKKFKAQTSQLDSTSQTGIIIFKRKDYAPEP